MCANGWSEFCVSGMWLIKSSSHFSLFNTNIIQINPFFKHSQSIKTRLNNKGVEISLQIEVGNKYINKIKNQ